MKLLTILSRLTLFLSWLPFVSTVQAGNLNVGQQATEFTLRTQDNKEFSLASRKGVGWTVLYFYPKAGTPGCTKQACAFRDGLARIRRLNAEVFGISTDDVGDLQAFQRKHKLTFTLLSDPDAKVAESYGVKIPILNVAKRWTFIVDPELRVRQVNDDVDPALDAQQVADSLQKLQSVQ
ncbi:MAG: peroxiredoxin [Gammaproteobacteria bacterium]